MNALFDIWYGMSRRGRVFCWCAGVLCLTLTVALSVGYPGWKTLADATQAGAVGDVTTLSSDLSVAAATSRVGFNIGRINGRLLDLELSALEQKQQLDIIASPGCWLRICSQPVSSKAAKFLIRFPAAKAARPPWNLKKRCWEWR